MSNDGLGNASEPGFVDQPATPVTSVPDSFSPESQQALRVAKLTRSLGRLYTWLGLLTGVSLVSIGLLAGAAFWLKREQDQLQQQLRAVNAYKAEIDRLKNLESRITSLESQANLLNQNTEALNQQLAKGLPTQIKGMQNDLFSVKASLQQVQANAVTKEQLAQSLQRARLDQYPPGNFLPQNQNRPGNFLPQDQNRSGNSLPKQNKPGNSSSTRQNNR